jgi:protocatechuate 3,4-dioxygenase beta subunit
MQNNPTRRAFLAGTGALALAASLGLIVRAQETPPPQTGTETLPLTPECVDGDDLTPAQTEGPYFTPNSPERASLLEPGMTGTRLLVSGYVLTTGCQPVASALIDFWQADDAGQYDNVGYRLRGHQYTDEFGRYTLETVMPGLYPGRTRHIHVKVQAPNARVLTTQLYFEGEARNRTDGIFNPRLVLTPIEVEGGRAATFNFVVTA